MFKYQKFFNSFINTIDSVLKLNRYNILYMLNCPYCLSEKSKVTDKRPSSQGIRRRRECLSCKNRYTTYENVEKHSLYVIKKDNTREKFSSDKLSSGIKKAFEKRPIPIDKIEIFVREVEESIRKKGKKEIQSSKIGDIIMKKMKKIDSVAYIRFASVYRDFKDISDFKQEIKELK
jgi:transcriptional repressor NrdR